MKLNIQMFGGRGSSSSNVKNKNVRESNRAYSKILDQSLKLATANSPTISDYKRSIEAMADKPSFQYKIEEYEKEIKYLEKKQTLADGKITGYSVNDIAEKRKEGRQYLINDRDVYYLNYDKNKHRFISTKVFHKSKGISIAGRGRHFFMKDTDVKDLIRD